MISSNKFFIVKLLKIFNLESVASAVSLLTDPYYKIPNLKYFRIFRTINKRWSSKSEIVDLRFFIIIWIGI